MMWAKQSTAITVIIGPVLDSAGAEYTSAVIGDISISKNGGTLTALASAATLTHIANGQYTLVFRTADVDTLGRAQIFCNKSTYQMPSIELMVMPATVFDALITNAAGGANGLVLSLASNQVDVGKWLGTAVSTPTVAGVPNVNVKTWNDLTTVALPLVPTTAGRTLDVSAGGEAGVDWANVGSPTTTLALTGTTIATTQKVDIETIKTNPVVNAGTITFPTTATLASTTNITAGTITTATNVTTVNGLAAGVITAASIAADAITDAKVASDVTIASVTGAVGSVTGNVGGNVTGSVGSIATGGIASASFSAGAINAAAIAADAITDAKVASDVTIASVTGAVGSVTGSVGSVTGAVGSVTGNVGGNVTGSVGSIASGGITEASYATTAGSFAPLQIVDRGTAQAATGTTLQLRAAAAFADSELIGATIVIRTATSGAGQSRVITAYTSATDTATVDTWTTTPTGTITYDIFGTAKGSASTNLVDVTRWNGTAVSTPATAGIPDVNVKNIDNDAASASGTVTFPNATLASTTNITAGTLTTVTTATNVTTVNGLAAGVITAASIAADAITDAKVASDVTIASVTGAVGSVTGAVGSVTGNVGGNVVGSVSSVSGNVGGNVAGSVGSVATGGIAAASFAAGAIDAAAIATDAIGALELAAGAASEIATAVRTELTTELGRIDATVSSRASQTTLDTLDDYVDTEVAAIKAKTDQLTFTIANQVDSNALSGGGGLDAAGVRSAVGLASANLDTQLSTIDDFLDTEIGAIKAKTDNLPASPASTTNITAATGIVLSGVTHTGAVIPTVSAVTGLTASNLDAAISSRATPAQVNDEVVDCLNVDTYPELSAPPAATSTLRDKITWLFMWARNKATQTSSQRKLYADDTTTVVGTEAVSDDGTTYTKGEVS